MHRRRLPGPSSFALFTAATILGLHSAIGDPGFIVTAAAAAVGTVLSGIAAVIAARSSRSQRSEAGKSDAFGRDSANADTSDPHDRLDDL